MAVKNPQFEINLRKNDNSAMAASYGKYYPKAVEKKTISLRGLCNHMAEHNSIYGRDVIGGVLTKMSNCIIELLSQGNPVKIDGLGTFVPTVESVKMGITKTDILAGKWNASNYVKAIHIRFRPEGNSDDDITSRMTPRRSSSSSASLRSMTGLPSRRAHQAPAAVPLSPPVRTPTQVRMRATRLHLKAVDLEGNQAEPEVKSEK